MTLLVSKWLQRPLLATVSQDCCCEGGLWPPHHVTFSVKEGAHCRGLIGTKLIVSADTRLVGLLGTVLLMNGWFLRLALTLGPCPCPFGVLSPCLSCPRGWWAQVQQDRVFIEFQVKRWALSRLCCWQAYTAKNWFREACRGYQERGSRKVILFRRSKSHRPGNGETPALLGRPGVWFGAGCHIHPSGCQYTKGHLDLLAQFSILYKLFITRQHAQCQH